LRRDGAGAKQQQGGCEAAQRAGRGDDHGLLRVEVQSTIEGSVVACTMRRLLASRAPAYHPSKINGGNQP
jgi:hypothetical protein